MILGARAHARTKPVCVKCGLGRAGAARRRRAYRCCSGPGVTVPKCRCSGIVPATLDSESSLVVLPGPACSAGCVGEELAVDRVADATFQGSHRFFAGLAFGLSA